MDKKILFLLFFIILFSLNAWASPTTLFSDNFNDGTISDWDVNSGTWSAAAFDLNGGNLDGASISHGLALTSSSSLGINFSIKLGATGVNGEFAWLTDNNGLANFSGYQVVANNVTVALRRGTNGSFSNLISTSGLSVGVYHDINVVQSGTFFSLVVDGVTIGTASDSTYSSGSKIYFSTDNSSGANAFDNLLITGDANTGSVTILRPIDEKTLLNINKPWSVQQSSNSIYSFVDNNASSKSFIVTRNEVNTFYVDDSNASGTTDEYNSRAYVVYISSTDSNSVTIQPYLPKIVDALLVNIEVIDIPTNLTVPSVKITLSAPVGSSLVEIESRLTNSLGQAQFSMLQQKDYNISVDSPDGNTNYFTGIISPLSLEPVININFSSSNIIFNQKQPIITYAPRGDTFVSTGTTQRIDFNASVDFDFNYFVVELFDRNVIRNTTTSASNPFNSSLTATLSQFDQNTILVKLTVVGKDYNSYYYKTYHFFGSNTNGVLGFRNLSSTFSSATIAALIVLSMIGCLYFFGQGFPGNNEALVIPVGMVGAGLVYLLLPSYIFYMMGALTLGGILWLFLRLGRS